MNTTTRHTPHKIRRLANLVQYLWDHQGHDMALTWNGRKSYIIQSMDAPLTEGFRVVVYRDDLFEQHWSDRLTRRDARAFAHWIADNQEDWFKAELPT